jgi:hypothetical protein
MINDRIKINYKNNLRELGLTSGKFKLLFNIFINVLGSNENGRVYISEISPSRTEIKVKLVDDNTTEFNSFNEIEKDERVGNYVANFGNNETILITNWIKNSDGDLIFKLYKELPDEFDIKTQLWISKIIADPIDQEVEIEPEPESEVYNTLSGPNWNIRVTDVDENDSGFKSWNDILSTETNTSQTLIDKYFSQSFCNSAELNIDYSDYNNFVHFGSAQEKLDNFVYKLQLIETYDSRDSVLNELTQSETIANELNQVNINRRKVINGFDGYEKYLYYETSSNYTIEKTYNVSSSTEVYYATTWPKSGEWDSYVLYPTTSSEAVEWYQSQSEVATIYDRTNPHSLINTVPEYIKYDKYNDEYILFVNMVGHFFDNIWTYIKGFNDLYLRENDISLGLSKDLIYNMLESLGLNLNNGNNLVDLWQYSLGSNISGSYLNSGSEFRSLSSEDITVEIWNRILNNLPYLLKTKGTKRGIQALLTCYGIPSTLINIKEYGGPVEPGVEWNKENKFERFFYYLPLSGSQYLTGIVPNDIETIEMRVNFTSQSTDKDDIQSIFKVGDTNLYISKSGTNGVLKISNNDNIISSSELRLFDGDFWNIMLVSSSNDQLYVKKYKDGEKIYSEKIGSGLPLVFPDLDGYSTFYTSDLKKFITSDLKEFNVANETNIANQFIIGSGSFDGGIHEVRFWNKTLIESDFIEHSRSPQSIRILSGNPYDNLISRYSFNNPANLYLSTSINNVCPNKSNNTDITASGFTSEVEFPYNYQYSSYLATPLTPSIGFGINSNKTRVENNYLITSYSLQPDIRSEVREYDYAPLDSPRVGVYFSLTNLINERIVEVYSNESFDNYIGDPADQFNGYYSKLESVSQDFWFKYAPTMSFREYLNIIKPYDPSLFDIIRKSLPARSKKQVGLVVEPNILQRSRVPKQPNPTWENESYESLISIGDEDKVIGDNQTYDTIVSNDSINNIIGGNSTYESIMDNNVSKEIIGDNSTYNVILVTNNTNDIICSENNTYNCLLRELKNIKSTQVYIMFNASNLPTDSDVGISYPTIYPQCNFLTSSAYSPYTGSSESELLYSRDNYIYNSDRSTGYLAPRYTGCLQTEETTLDGNPPVEIFITTANKLITKDGGKINLAIK